jgi:hypothetical protein
MKTLTAAAEQARQRSWVGVRYRLTLTLWRDRYGTHPYTFTTRWSDRDELTPAVVRPRPVEDRWLRAGPGLGPDWVVPATGGPWDAFRIARRGQIQLGDRTRRALVRYAPWIPPGNQRATVTLPAGCSLLGAAEAGVALRLTPAADGYLVTAGTGADIDLSPTVGLRILVAGALTGAVWQRDDIVWDPEDRLTAEVLDLTGGDRLITVRRNDVVLGQYRDTSVPGPFVGGGLGLTAVSHGGSEGLPLGPLVGGAIPSPPATTAVAWQGLVLAWDGIEDALAPTNPAISIGHLALVLDNTRAVDGIETGIIARDVMPAEGWPEPPTVPARRVSDLFRIGTNAGGYDLGTSEAILEVAFEGHDPATDAVRLFRLMLDDLEDVTEDTVRLNCSGIELAYEDWDTLLRITTDRFPDAAPEAVGQVVPLLCGDLHRAKVYFVQAGMLDRLRVEVPETQAAPFWLQLSEPEKVRRLPVPGQLQIEAEVLTYDQTRPYGTATEIATVHITERAARGTSPAPHRAGVEARALSSSGMTPEYVGIIGQNRSGLGTQSWTQVYSDGMAKEPTAAPAHTVELGNTTLWPGQSLAVVRFASTAISGELPGAGVLVAEQGFAGMRAPVAYYPVVPGAYNVLLPANPQGQSHWARYLYVGHLQQGPPNTSILWNVYRGLFRFSVADLTTMPPSLAWWTIGPLPEGGIWPAVGSAARLVEVDWPQALGAGAATAAIRQDYGVIMPAWPGYDHRVDQQWTADVSPSLDAAQSEGRTILTFRLQVIDETPIADGTPGSVVPWGLPAREDGGPSVGAAVPVS